MALASFVLLNRRRYRPICLRWSITLGRPEYNCLFHFVQRRVESTERCPVRGHYPDQGKRGSRCGRRIDVRLTTRIRQFRSERPSLLG